MRRFSQRSHLVTLSEINITPLLDLAFVLLIIFVITTPLLEQGREQLPKGGRPDRALRKEDFRIVEVGSTGDAYRYQGKLATLAQIQTELVREQRVNPNVMVYLRAGRTTPWEKVFKLQDMCANLQIAVSLRSEPLEKR
jgi:biopolymer transport protein ExbD